MKTSLQKQIKYEGTTATHKVPKTGPVVTSEKNRFKDMHQDLEKAEPLYILGYKIRG